MMTFDEDSLAKRAKQFKRFIPAKYWFSKFKTIIYILNGYTVDNNRAEAIKF